MTVRMGNAVNRAQIDIINHMPRYPVPRLPPAFPFILGVEPRNEAKKDSCRHWHSVANSRFSQHRTMYANAHNIFIRKHTVFFRAEGLLKM